MTAKLLGIVLLAAYCSNIVTADIDLNQLNVNELQNKLPAEFAKTNISIEDAKTLLRDKCIEVSGQENGTAAFNEIESGSLAFVECFNDIVNFTAIQEEINEASPRGELDVVFHRYCNKRELAMECVETLNSKLVPCLDKEERANQDVFMRIIHSLLNFVCHKGGDHIALFIAEKGPECLKSKQDDIQQCLNNTFSNYMPKDGIENVKKLPKLIVDQKTCDDMETLELCIVNKLETCSEITPANIVESMFRFIRNETICHNNSKSHASHHMTNAAAELKHMNIISLVLSLMIFAAVTKFVHRC